MLSVESAALSWWLSCDRPELYSRPVPKLRITNVAQDLSQLNSSAFHLPYDSALVEPAKALRQRPTAAESKLWHEFLNRFPYRVLRQRPIHHFIVDFYCARLKLVIEVDGAVHFTADAEAHDAERTQILAGYGLRVIRFTNQQVMEDFEAVCRRIEGEIPLAPLKRGNRRREEENGSRREDKGEK
ncbi:MAG: endonuclease domain-containing protein [Pegethrix bostrychoides GSE-TBD4-15B]|uniref:Endonuclease domain-containing protein n=1 Tax=Pegethrix bostrychoides GSE-TBD4-15B TaxID=2839662 RepID=A0A951PC07_9CYAN|nr:endonuclease domain-containing protein [Pegethrix bostrychoides GSE-TBD4-15B]